MKTLISNARVISPADGFNEICDILIHNRHIQKIGRLKINEADCRIEANNLLAVPGSIDLACKLSLPKHKYSAETNYENTTILSAGVTTVCCLPDKEANIPLMMTAPTEATNVASPKLCMIGAISKELKGETLSEMMALKQAGYIAVTNLLYPFANTNVLKRALEYATGLDLPIMLYPWDHALAKDGCMHAGAIATKLGLTGIPVSAETAALAQYLALMEDTGAKVHFCRISCARSIEMIANARRAGLSVTADVSINHLFLTDEDILDFDSNCHVLPPFRTQEDRAALREGIRDGILDSICSDHCPLDTNAKLAPFPSTEPGISSIETFMPLVLELAAQNIIPLERAISAVSCSPARIIGADAGRLCAGAVADICLIDPHQSWELNKETMLSSGKNTPFMGRSFQGRVKQVILNGATVYEDTHPT